MKRELYWVAVGVAVAHLSIAEIADGKRASVRRFGDCPECARSQAVGAPLSSAQPLLGKNLADRLSSFVYGNGSFAPVSGAQIDAFAAASRQEEQARAIARSQELQLNYAPLISPPGVKPQALQDFSMLSLWGLNPSDPLAGIGLASAPQGASAPTLIEAARLDPVFAPLFQGF